MEEKEQLLEKWQARLGLSDWAISLDANAQPQDMTLQNVNGETEYNEVTKSAVIRILGEEYRSVRVRPFNFEKTLLHELLHLKLCLLDESGNDFQDRYVHQLIDDLARAFAETAQETIAGTLAQGG